MRKGCPGDSIDTLSVDIHGLESYDRHDKQDKREDKEDRRFTARIRHSGTSTIITIPVKTVRELNIKEGDNVEIQIYKKYDTYSESK